MRIRWKFLLVLLSISLLPILVMRWKGQREVRLLGRELAQTTSEVLIAEASTALKRLVEDHARVLAGERDLLIMALQLQVAELNRRLGGNPPEALAEPRTIMSARERSTATPGDAADRYCRLTGMGRCVPQAVSFTRQTFHIAAKTPPDIALDTLTRLESMLAVYRSLVRQHPKLIFWQFLALDNGVQSVYPAVPGMPTEYDALQTDWYWQAKESDTMVWTLPGLDPFTRKIQMVVSMPVPGPDGGSVGVAAIAVPVSAVLHENEHIRMLSPDVITLLVRAEKLVQQDSGLIRVIAKEGQSANRHQRWRAPLEAEVIEPQDPVQYAALFDDLTRHRSGVREMPYKGRRSLLAYGCIDAHSTALMLIVPRADVVAEADGMEKYVRVRVGELIRATSLLLLGVMLLVIGLAFFLSRSLTRNIHKLVEGTRRIAAGDFTTRVRISARDEMGELGRTFNRMVPALAERVKIKQALDVAMEVQQNLLPRAVPSIEGLDIAARIVYCDETGGDFYDFIELPGEGSPRLGVAVGDVSGHGISAALLMATVRAFLRSRLFQPGDLGQIITDVNRLLARDTQDTFHFVTLLYMEIEPRERRLRWVRAGHEPILCYDPAQDAFEELKGAGVALGVDACLSYPENHQTGLTDGQVLCLATDGLWEAFNRSGERFGRERMKALIRSHAHASAGQILASMVQALQAFTGSSSLKDDITLVVIKLNE